MNTHTVCVCVCVCVEAEDIDKGTSLLHHNTADFMAQALNKLTRYLKWELQMACYAAA
jgi:hypothetical protein